MISASVEIVAGRLGVGAICFLALFLMADGMQVGVFQLVETYGNSVTFGIVAALPTAVVAYILGIYCVGVADLFVSRFESFREPSPQSVYRLSKSGGELLRQEYAEIMRNFELLKGSSVAFFLLAIGALLDVTNMRGFEVVVALVFIGAIIVALLSLVFASQTLRKGKSIVEVDFEEAP
jgi:hypothetical protein